MPPSSAPNSLALRGRIVTMDSLGAVMQDGVVYISDKVIVAAQPASAPALQGSTDGNAAKERGLMLANRLPLSQELQPETIDRLTVADDKTFLDRLRHQVDLPDCVKTGLPNLF